MVKKDVPGEKKLPLYTKAWDLVKKPSQRRFLIMRSFFFKRCSGHERPCIACLTSNLIIMELFRISGATQLLSQHPGRPDPGPASDGHSRAVGFCIFPSFPDTDGACLPKPMEDIPPAQGSRFLPLRCILADPGFRLSGPRAYRCRERGHCVSRFPLLHVHGLALLPRP